MNRLDGNATEYGTDLIGAPALRHHVPNGFGEKREKQQCQDQRHGATQHQHAAPTQMRDHPGRQEAAEGSA